MKKRRITALLLTAAILSSALVTASCGDTGEKKGETNAPVSDDGTTAPETAADPFAGLPEKDYGGYEFNIATNDYQESDFVSDEQTGDVFSDAIYARNSAVEEKFGVKLKTTAKSWMDMKAEIQQLVNAGEDHYDLIAQHAVSAGDQAIAGYYYNWYDVPYVDMTKDWWSSAAEKQLSYKNEVLYLAVGDAALTTVSGSWLMVFDKKQAESYKLGSLYDIVREGKWTLDKLLDLTKNVYSDLNGDNKRGIEDFYGYVNNTNSGLNAFLWSCDNPILKMDKDGVPRLSFMTEKLTNIVEKAMFLADGNPGGFTDQKYNSNWNASLPADMFMDEKCIIATSTLSDVYSKLRYRESLYGILPYPKYDEDQQKYITQVDGSHAMLSIPVTVSDVERSGIITEALCAKTHEIVVPTYIETVIKAKLSDAKDDAEMAQLIIDSREFDYGYIYSGVTNRLGFIMQYISSGQAESLASYYASNESSIKERLDEFYNKLDWLIADN